jgi:hypothetical protein
MDEREDDCELTKLTNLLDELHLQQDRISSKIKRANKLVHDIKSKRKTGKDKQIIKKPRGTVPEIGDHILVINPKEGQITNSTVIGFTKTDFVKIQGSNGSIVQRIPRNIRIHKEV